MLLRRLVLPIRLISRFFLFTRTSYQSNKPLSIFKEEKFRIQNLRARFFSSQPYQEEGGQIPEEVIKILQSIGYVFSQFYNLGRYQEANKVNEEYRLQLEMMEFPQDHPAYLTYLNNKALLLKNDGKYQQALEIYQDVLQKYKEYYKANTPSMAVVYGNLATLKQLMGRPEDALQDIEEAITIKTNTKADEVNIALSVSQKASILKDLKQFQESYKLLRGALEVVAISKGEDSLQSLNVMADMAMLEKARGNYEKAEGDFERVIQNREKILGDNHPNTLAVKHNLAELYRVWGKLEKAETLFNQIAETIRQREEDDAKLLKSIIEEESQNPANKKIVEDAKVYQKARTEYLQKKGKKPHKK